MKMMKYLSVMFVLLAGSLTFWACGSSDDEEETTTKPSTPEPPASTDSNNVKKFETFTETVNGVEFKMIAVKGGSFSMGTDEDLTQGGWTNEDEMPAHKVTLSDFFIGETEVTQALWQAVMGSNPAHFKGTERPVETVTYTQCQQFVKKLSQLTGRTYRLPTEAEWEFAARGGNSSKGYLYSGTNTAGRGFWYYDNTLTLDPENPYLTHVGEHQEVGRFMGNELKIKDMSGNVWEWCSDHYGPYPSEPQVDPAGSNKYEQRVIRGGSYEYDEWYCRCTCRGYANESYSFNNLGLRVALPMKKTK